MCQPEVTTLVTVIAEDFRAYTLPEKRWQSFLRLAVIRARPAGDPQRIISAGRWPGRE